MTHSNAANRLDRMPISRFHKSTLLAISFAYFFEFADINSFATTVPKLITLWGVTITQIAYVTSASFVGMFFGSLIASWLADRWGRKKALIITTLWFSAFSFAAVFSWDMVSLGAFRVLTSAGLAAMTVVAVIYVNEIFPAALLRRCNFSGSVLRKSQRSRGKGRSPCSASRPRRPDRRSSLSSSSVLTRGI